MCNRKLLETSELAPLPKTHAFDSTLSLFLKGYRFISDQCHTLNAEVFRTRLLLRNTICMQGAAAAQLFYDQEKFLRQGAMPMRAQKTLVGIGGVQGLDGSPHQHRKRLFVGQLMNAEKIAALAELHRLHWHTTLALWPLQQDMVVFDQAQQLLCRTVCAWAGVPLKPPACVRRAKEFGLMIDSGARIGWHHWRGRWARACSEKWITTEIKKIRATDSENVVNILQAFAWHRDEAGQLLPPHVAAVEVINVLRPTVAIAQLIAFSVLAMHQYPHTLKQLQSKKQPGYLDWFVLEVRRFYPFFPFLAAYTRHDFTWKGWEFKKGTLTLLDIYGTHHDPQHWHHPEMFDPERFKHREPDDYSFIANGGASYTAHHRCPGEWITNQLMKVVIKLLVENLRFEVPEQDLQMSLTQIPTLPKSRMKIRPLSYQPS